MDSFQIYHMLKIPLLLVLAACFSFCLVYVFLTWAECRYLRISIGVTTRRFLWSGLVGGLAVLVLVVTYPGKQKRVSHTFTDVAVRTVTQHTDTTYFIDLIAGNDTVPYESGNCDREGHVRWYSQFSTYNRKQAAVTASRLLWCPRLAYDACSDIQITSVPVR